MAFQSPSKLPWHLIETVEAQNTSRSLSHVYLYNGGQFPIFAFIERKRQSLRKFPSVLLSSSLGPPQSCSRESSIL